MAKAHVRKQLRDAVKARLETVEGLALVADMSRLARELQPHDLPAALVAVAETAAVEDRNPEGQRALRRTLQVAVKLVGEADLDSVEDELDALAVDVEKALAVSDDLGVGTVVGWSYDGATAVTPEATISGAVLTVTLNYSCAVLTTDVDPTANLYS